jgi:possible mobilisation protein
MPKDKKINIRLTEKEKSIIESKANKCNMTITKFIVSSCLKDKIIIVNGLDKVDSELRRIGNNINQLTRLANEKIITVVDLKELRMEVNNIWQLLKQLVQKQT